MYARNFRGQSVGASFIPPDYRGNAFELAGADRRPASGKYELSGRHEAPAQREPHGRPKSEKPATRSASCGCGDNDADDCRAPDKGGAFTLGGLHIGMEEILLGALIIILLNAHADDTLLLMLCVIFIAGL